MDSSDDFLEILDLSDQGEDVWLGRTPTGSDRPNLFGGLVAAQALRAAHLTVDHGRHPHSIHAYFLSAGRFGQDIRLRVHHVRDGRSFSVRSVEVSQSGVPVLVMTSSFQCREVGDEYRLDRSGDPEPPDRLPRSGTAKETGTSGDGPFEMVEDNPPGTRRGSLEWTALRYWARTRTRIPEDPGLHACALVAMGDLRTGSPPRIAMTTGEPSRMTSLDYSMWFVGPSVADDWMMFDLRPGGNGGGRGLTVGVVQGRQGQMATMAMELLFRLAR